MAVNSVTVAIVTHNSELVIADCLRALPGACDGVDVRALVVADSGSTDATLLEVARAAPHARCVELNGNRGYAAGINAAVRASPEADAVLILNADVRLARHSVRRLAQAIDGTTGIAVPRLEAPDGSLQLSLRREPSVLRAFGEALLGQRAGRVRALGEVVVDRDCYDRPGTADWATGAVLLVSRACLHAVGEWDESFFLYSEETDFALRARDRGYALRYVPAARAVHLEGDGTRSPGLWSVMAVNRVALYRRRHGRVASALFRTAVLVNESLRAAMADGRTHRRAAVALLRSRS
jgi:GT2 family glycosyltransferase